MHGKSHNSGDRQRGYTLMELMVVLALIAVAAALVVPSIGHAFANLQLRMAASSMAEIFKQARVHAVYEGRSVVVLFGPAEESPRNLYLVRDDGRTLAHVALPRDVRLRVEQRGAWSYVVQPVHFFHDGSSEAMQIDLEDQRERHVQLTLDPLTARARLSQIYGGADSGVTVSRGGQ